ncbi:MAG: hypothetical protein E6G76_19550 [Alphaproteobacteria bacterium]|nr:MAG: hypothetical protein E6G76_19550 [Alphaproteobacteria bacterium]
MSAAPVIERIAGRAFRFPTDAPEADGTLAWDHTTAVIAEASAGGVWTRPTPAQLRLQSIGPYRLSRALLEREPATANADWSIADKTYAELNGGAAKKLLRGRALGDRARGSFRALAAHMVGLA